MPDEDHHDAFADAKLTDSMKLLDDRRNFFRAIAFEHVATQDCIGGDMVETVTIRWRPLPKPETNGFSHGPLS